MADPLTPAKLKTSATRKIRLAEFATGKSDLRPEHKAWIDGALNHLTAQDQFFVQIIGYASKLGPKNGGYDSNVASDFNRQLSYERASVVARYMESQSARVTSRIREFSARGSDDYNAPASDDSGEQRAVEVHIFLVPVEPPPPPGTDPIPELPGGRRFTQWAVAAPGGLAESIIPGAVAAANIVLFRCHELKDRTHGYLVAGGGAGISYAGPKLGKLVELIKQVITRGNYAGISFTDATAITPFNFTDLDGATCEVRSGGAGVGVGYQLCYVSVWNKVWFRESTGRPFFATKDFVKGVDCRGPAITTGIGASSVGGPMVRLD